MTAIERAVEAVRRDGAAVLAGVFSSGEVAMARGLVVDNLGAMPNTRPTRSSRHLAGFHRSPQLQQLHDLLMEHPVVVATRAALVGPDHVHVGMTDITVNRSQPWHKDLLRGPYRRHLRDAEPCAQWHGSVFKVLVYLQPSTSLRIVVGSHRRDIDLDDDARAVPVDHDEVRTVAADVGDVVLLDVCTTHRGADEAFYAGRGDAPPSILVSAVYGAADSGLTADLTAGNAARQADWDDRHLGRALDAVGPEASA